MTAGGPQELTQSAADGRTYMPQLDSLRAFAVLGVLVTHYLGNPKLPWLLGELNPGGLGVRLFFVLSGFLITRILLDCRDLSDSGDQKRLTLVRQFYIRRFLRIFPIYYLVIGVALIVDAQPARELWPWLVSYTTNLHVTLNQKWIGMFGHFWTLAVEEQFYLIWPWVVLYLRRQWLVPVIVFAIALGPLYRLFTVINFPADVYSGNVTTGTLTFASLDTLGAGALLALVSRSKAGEKTARRYLTRIGLPAGALSLLLMAALVHYGIDVAAYVVLSGLSTALVSCWLIAFAARGFQGLQGRILEFKPLAFAGRISYGIYVYHNFVPHILSWALEPLGLTYPESRLAAFVLSTTVTVCIAAMSWHLIERPINGLKRHHDYSPASSAHLAPRKGEATAA